MRADEADEGLANQLALIVAAGALGHIGRPEIRGHAALLVAFLAPPMARHAALAAGLARFFAGPLMGRALLMRCLATLAGNLALLGAVHRRESAILFSHTDLLPHHVLLRPSLAAADAVPSAVGCNGSATAHEDGADNPQQ